MVIVYLAVTLVVGLALLALGYVVILDPLLDQLDILR